MTQYRIRKSLKAIFRYKKEISNLYIIDFQIHMLWHGFILKGKGSN